MELQNIFEELDTDGSGSIEMREFLEWTKNSRARAFFERVLGIDGFKAGHTFKLLDIDGTGQLEKEEFVVGCLRLKRGTTAIDSELIMRAMKALQQDMRKIKHGLIALDDR